MATKAKAGSGKSSKKGGGRTTPRQTKGVRYTPPVAKNVKTSPRWMGPLILAFFLIGVVVVIVNYAGSAAGRRQQPLAHRRDRLDLRRTPAGHPLPLTGRVWLRSERPQARTELSPGAR